MFGSLRGRLMGLHTLEHPPASRSRPYLLDSRGDRCHSDQTTPLEVRPSAHRGSRDDRVEGGGPLDMGEGDGQNRSVAPLQPILGNLYPVAESPVAESRPGGTVPAPASHTG